MENLNVNPLVCPLKPVYYIHYFSIFESTSFVEKGLLEILARDYCLDSVSPLLDSINIRFSG